MSMIATGDFQISKRLVLINSASSVVTRVLSVTVLLWAYQYLIRRIPAEEFAVYPVVTALMMGAPLFFLMFSGGISRFIVEAHVKREPDGVAAVASSIMPFLALAASVFLVVALLVAFYIDQLLNIAPSLVGDAQVMVVLLASTFTVRMLCVPFEAGFHVRQRFVELNLLGVGQEMLKILILLALLLGVGPRVLWVVVATASADLVFTVIMVARAVHLLPTLRLRLGMFDRRRALNLMSFGVWTMVGHLSTLMQIHSAIIILNLFSTAVSVTSFYIGSTLHTQINRTVQMGISPLQPVMTAMHSTEDHSRLARTAMRGGRYACWIVMAIAAPLAIYAQEFVSLYVGPTYSSAAWAIVLLMAVQAISRPTALMAMAAIAKAEVRSYYLANLAVMCTAVVAMVLAVLVGGNEVAVALALALVIATGYVFFFWPFFLRLIDTPVDVFLRNVVAPGMTPALVGGALWLLLKLTITIDSWDRLVLCVAAGGITYIAVLLAVCLSPTDKADLQMAFRRARAAL